MSLLGLLKKRCCCGWKLTPCVELDGDCMECHGVFDKTPKYYTPVVSGVTLWDGCDGCSEFGTKSSRWDTAPSIGPNGTLLPGLNGTPNPLCALSTECQYGKFETVTGQIGGSGVNDTCSSPFALAISRYTWELRINTEVTPSGQFAQRNARAFFTSHYLAPGRGRCFAFWGWTNDVTVDRIHFPAPTAFDECFIGQPVGINWWPRAGQGGSVTVYAGAMDGRCPGGAPVIVSNNLSPHDGNVITLTEDAQEVCYTVTLATPAEVAAAILADEFVTLDAEVIATLIECGDNCGDCCDDNCP